MEANPNWQNLQHRMELKPLLLDLAQAVCEQHHYLHRRVADIARPYAYAILLDGKQIGVQIWARPHFTHKRGYFGPLGSGEPSTHWQWLSLARLWCEDDTPPNVESMSIRMALTARNGHHAPRLEADYLAQYPPIYPDEPYRLTGIITWADTSFGHQGTIYEAAGFEFAGESRNAGRRHAKVGDAAEGVKRCYVLRLEPCRCWKPMFKPHPSTYAEQPSLFQTNATGYAAARYFLASAKHFGVSVALVLRSRATLASRARDTAIAAARAAGESSVDIAQLVGEHYSKIGGVMHQARRSIPLQADALLVVKAAVAIKPEVAWQEVQYARAA